VLREINLLLITFADRFTSSAFVETNYFNKVDMYVSKLAVVHLPELTSAFFSIF